VYPHRCWSHARCPLSVVPVHASPEGEVWSCVSGSAMVDAYSTEHLSRAFSAPQTPGRGAATASRAYLSRHAPQPLAYRGRVQLEIDPTISAERAPRSPHAKAISITVAYRQCFPRQTSVTGTARAIISAVWCLRVPRIRAMFRRPPRSTSVWKLSSEPCPGPRCAPPTPPPFLRWARVRVAMPKGTFLACAAC